MSSPDDNIVWGDAFDRQVDRAKALIFIWVSCPLISFLTIYLLGSFTAGSTDPTTWTADSRAMALFPWLLFTFVSVGVSISMLDGWVSSEQRVRELQQALNAARDVNAKND